jgi:hypothetical protein
MAQTANACGLARSAVTVTLTQFMLAILRVPSASHRFGTDRGGRTVPAVKPSIRRQSLPHLLPERPWVLHQQCQAVHAQRQMVLVLQGRDAGVDGQGAKVGVAEQDGAARERDRALRGATR